MTVASNPELRFDMTQDGKAQTAEHFDAWMDAQGVQVAKGAEPDPADAQPATVTADPKVAPASSGETR